MRVLSGSVAAAGIRYDGSADISTETAAGRSRAKVDCSVGSPGLPVQPKSLSGLCGRKATLNARSGVIMVQELCESRGGRPGLSVLTSLLVSVDVTNY